MFASFKGFKGGIHPSEHKEITEDVTFVNLSVPGKVYIPLQQHIGAPAKPVVFVGDTVKEGDLIAEATAFVSTNIHSSVPGKVVEIVESSSLYQGQGAIVIEVEGAFVDPKAGNPDNLDDLSKEEILKRIKDAGIVGLGGAAFPTSVKLSPPPDKKIDLLVINGAECEPYLTVDDVLMRTFPEEILKGIVVTLKALSVDKAIIGIEDNKGRAVKILKEKIKELSLEDKISAVPLKTKYPQGAEKQLIYSLTKREVPSRGLPMDVGVVVQNVGTIYAINEAVYYKKSLYERYITVSGKMINKPGNYKVRLGTKFSDIVEDCGGLKGEPAKIVLGGPMCGTSIYDLEMSVVKGTSGILFLSEDEVAIGDFSACIRCGKCVTACPVGLVPCDIATAVENNRLDIAKTLNPYDCIMCSSCSYSCPANRPLSHFIKLAQQGIKHLGA